MQPHCAPWFRCHYGSSKCSFLLMPSTTAAGLNMVEYSVSVSSYFSCLRSISPVLQVTPLLASCILQCFSHAYYAFSKPVCFSLARLPFGYLICPVMHELQCHAFLFEKGGVAAENLPHMQHWEQSAWLLNSINSKGYYCIHIMVLVTCDPRSVLFL